MRRLTGHRIGVEQGSIVLFSDYEDGGVMWTGEGQRELRRMVAFSEPFRAAPAVHVTMTMWDLDQKSNQRADISAEDVSREGFAIVFRTWGDTRVARIRADWLAIGEIRHEDDWDVE
ncbi:H-type lectin domain-containing protein [Albidovulum sp.]